MISRKIGIPLTVLLLGMILAGYASSGNSSGVPAAVWSTKGNRATNPGSDYLGTTDDQPLIIKTNSAPAVTVGTAGPVEIHKSLVVHGDATVDDDLHVGEDLSAGGDISLGGSLSLDGSATIGGDLSVAGDARFARDAVVGRDLSVAGLTTSTTMQVSGTTTTGVLEITGGDLAEPFVVSETGAIHAGSVLVIDEAHPGALTLSRHPYDRRVAGVVSGALGIGPGIVLYRQRDAPNLRHVALEGRVYALADASRHPIRSGDLLTSSAIPGHLMAVTDYQRARGAVIGKAMSSLDRGQGLVLVLVSLQ
jgi:hypothetical protein